MEVAFTFLARYLYYRHSGGGTYSFQDFFSRPVEFLIFMGSWVYWTTQQIHKYLYSILKETCYGGF